MDIYDISLYAGYLLVIVGCIAAVLLPLLKAFENPKELMTSGIAVLGILALFAVAYLISDNEVTPRLAAEPFNMTAESSQLIGGLLISCYFLFVIAFVGIFVTEGSKLLK
jgi:hypothetical protein